MEADDAVTLAQSYFRLAELLRVPGWSTLKKAEDVRAAVVGWLAREQGWLLVFDDLEEPDLLRPSEGAGSRPDPTRASGQTSGYAPPYLPGQVQGHVLVTSRSPETGWLQLPGGVVRELQPLTRAEAHRFMLRRTGRDARWLEPAEAQALEDLLQEFDGLPLALEHAAAYVSALGCSFAEYIATYRRVHLQLLERSSGAGKYPAAVGAAWELNFAQVERANPASAVLLRLCAFLRPEGIPVELFTEGTDALPEPLKGALDRAKDDPLRMWELLQPLRRYSLIALDTGHRTWDMHRLVQEAVRQHLGRAEQQSLVNRLIEALTITLPTADYCHHEKWKRLLFHALAVCDWASQHATEPFGTATFLNRVAIWLSEQAQFPRAESLHRRALAIGEKALGPDHPDVAASLSNLAALRSMEGRYTEAESLCQRALAIQEKAWGPAHPDVAKSLAVLAIVCQRQGRSAEAEALYRRALAIQGKALGPDHPDVAESLNNLALLCQYQGRAAEAEPLYRRSLAIEEKALGPDHPDVATSLNNLAGLLHTQGRGGEAEPLYRRALAIQEKALGPDHPHVAKSLNNLAYLCKAEGRYVEAEPLCQRALTIFEKALRPDHPHVAASLETLASLRCAQGRSAEAEPLYRRSLAIEEKALGPDHPDVATSLNNLAGLLHTQGRGGEAEPLYRRALAIGETALGPDHPDLAANLNNLGCLCRDRGRFAEAEPLHRRALAIQEKALGPDHPNTRQGAKNLEICLTALGRRQEGAKSGQFLRFLRQLGAWLCRLHR